MDWIDFRVTHLRERYAGGDFNAYIRLTEVEALKDFIERNEKTYERNN